MLTSLDALFDAAGETCMRRMLVVDDDPHICLAIRAWLKRDGFNASIADGGPSGLADLDNSTFDLTIVEAAHVGHEARHS